MLLLLSAGGPDKSVNALSIKEDKKRVSSPEGGTKICSVVS